MLNRFKVHLLFISILISTLLFTHQVKASSISSSENIDFSSIDDLTLLREKNINKIIEYKKKRGPKYTISGIEALKIKLEDISKSPTELTFIPRGAKLVEIKSEQIKYIKKDLTVNAHTLVDSAGFKFIQDKNEVIRYKVLNQVTTPIKIITNLYRGPKRFKRLNKKLDLDSDDKKLDLEINLKLQVGLQFLKVGKDIFEATNDTAAIFGIEGQFLLKKISPFYLGLSSSFESLTTSNTSGDLSLKTINLGPILKYQEKDSMTSFYIGAKTDIFTNVESNNQDDSSLEISQTSLELGIDFEKKNKTIGPTLIGINYKRSWLKAKSKAGTLISPNNSYDDAIIFNVGHRIESW